MNKIFIALMVMAVGGIAAASANVASQDKAVIAIQIPSLVVSASDQEMATHASAHQLLASPLTNSFRVQSLY